MCAAPATTPSGTCYYRYNGQPAGSLAGVNRDACASYCASYAPYGYSFYFNNDSVCAPAAPPAPPTPAPVNCQVSGWTDASGCSATVCGTQGTKQQTRTVTQQPMYGGAACPPLTQSVSCNAPPCPAPAPAQCYYRYNGGSPNQLPNLTKEQCAAYCAQYAPYGYSFYHNNDGSTNGAVCAPPAPTPAPPAAVNCQVSGWTDASGCSATVCGTQGSKQQTRTVTQAPMYGGTACPPLSQSITCSAPACAPINCQVSGWTDSSSCSATVCGTQGTKQQTRTVMQQPMYGGTACPPLSQSVSCSAPACAPTPTPVNCQVSGWTDSSGCSAVNCGTQGTKQQIRTVTQQPMYGGTACPPLSQSVSCSAPACPAPAPSAPSAPSAPISGANEWDQLLWPPGTPLCWKRKSSDNDLFSISQLTESECKTYCGSDTNCYFNATGDKTNHLNPKPDQANSKCMTGNWDAGIEVKVDGTKQTKADCARLCSTNGPYVYWEPETQNPQNSICEPNDKKKCWRPTLGVGKMLVPFQTGTTNLHSTQYERCAETCAYLDDQGRTSDNSMNNQYQRATTARFWSPRGITNANGQREKELCMDKNVKRCWYMNTSGQLDYPSTWTKRRLASDGTLDDQQLCDDTACNNSRLYKDVKWGTSRETGIDFCSNPNRRTTPL